MALSALTRHKKGSYEKSFDKKLLCFLWTEHKWVYITIYSIATGRNSGLLWVPSSHYWNLCTILQQCLWIVNYHGNVTSVRWKGVALTGLSLTVHQMLKALLYWRGSRGWACCKKLIKLSRIWDHHRNVTLWNTKLVLCLPSVTSHKAFSEHDSCECVIPIISQKCEGLLAIQSGWTISFMSLLYIKGMNKHM